MTEQHPDALISYTRLDNQRNGAALTTFREKLSDEVSGYIGQPFHIFQDIEDIKLGQQFEQRIDQALATITFFIPILTPSFFNSKFCRYELKKFLQREAHLGRNDLVLPVYYIRVPALENPALRVNDPLAQTIAARQRIDWRNLRIESFEAPQVRLTLMQMAEQIADVWFQSVSLEPLPSVFSPPPNEPKVTPSNRAVPARDETQTAPTLIQETELSREHQTKLREILITRFNSEELRTLCFDLNIDYDDLGGEGKAGKARELVAFLERRGRIADLVTIGTHLRPDVVWDEARPESRPPLPPPRPPNPPSWVPELVEIPAGPFLMGSSDDDPMADDDEEPQHRLELPTYWIGKTPVTNAQFRPFVEGDGYRNQDYWTETGWQWCEENKFVKPAYWNNAEWNGDDYPVVGVSWFEAVAYCRWLSAQTGQEFRLPTEAEWEKAARGPDGLLWPWGNTWEEGRCNSEEAGLDKTTPVRQYPSGASPYGTLDMAGNVWEWTSTVLCKAYPYKVEDEWRDAYLAGGNERTIRGGAWHWGKNCARGAYRLIYLDPRTRDNRLGLRLASHSPPGSDE